MGARIESSPPQRVSLPPMVMKAAKAITSDATMSPTQRLESVLVLIWGWAWYETQEEVKSSSVQVPDAQWRELHGFLVYGVPTDPMDQVNLGLGFMNSGPSSYTDGSEDI